MNIELTAVELDPIEARLRVLETAVATLARICLAKEVQPFFLQVVEDLEKNLFMQGLPVGSLPLGVRILEMKLVEPPDSSLPEQPAQ